LPGSTVRYHLHLAVRAGPGIPAEIKAAMNVTRVSPIGLRNLNDTVAFYEAKGRLPTKRPASDKESVTDEDRS
jgi:hypothetical protein